MIYFQDEDQLNLNFEIFITRYHIFIYIQNLYDENISYVRIIYDI